MRPARSLLFLLLLISPIPLEAQQSSSSTEGPSPSPLLTVPQALGDLKQQLAQDTVEREIRPTHWKEGALVGGLSLGIGMAILADAFCRGSEGQGTCSGAFPGGFLLGGVLGGLVGALIGGQFPKDTVP